MKSVTYKTKRLGINVDHVATLRQARGTSYPDPLTAARLAIDAGADGITIHLREDRRHIQDDDVRRMKASLNAHLNLEMALTDEMLAIALEVQPDYVCLVPEKREELTTEGGLNLIGIETRLGEACEKLKGKGIGVSLFIEADEQQIRIAKQVGATAIELHTGLYAELEGEAQHAVLEKLEHHARFASESGSIVNAGHGLHYQNVQAIVAIPEIYELNIGHSIVAQAIYDGIPKAVSDMKKLMTAS